MDANKPSIATQQTPQRANTLHLPAVADREFCKPNISLSYQDVISQTTRLLPLRLHPRLRRSLPCLRRRGRNLLLLLCHQTLMGLFLQAPR